MRAQLHRGAVLLWRSGPRTDATLGRAVRSKGYAGASDCACAVEPTLINLEFAIWKLKFGGQRLARKKRLRSPSRKKFGLQRLTEIRLSRGNVVTILPAWTWPTETALVG